MTVPSVKIKLILRADEFTSFKILYLKDLWDEFFDIEIYDSNKTYDRAGSVFVVWWMAADDPWPRQMQQQGYKVAVDNLWERPASRSDFYWIEHKYWFWWFESVWWRGLKQDTYQPSRDIKYIALMQIRSQKRLRDRVVADLGRLLPQMRWSYLAKGQRLTPDSDDPVQGQRYMHPSWYDQTYCSLVIESDQHLPLFVTEKSYKPLAYYHPFMIIGAPGLLDFLRGSGFETFDNLFDESYDTVLDTDSRLKIIYENLDRIDITKGYDALTLEKLAHNHARFFNESICKTNIRDEIILPLVRYAET